MKCFSTSEFLEILARQYGKFILNASRHTQFCEKDSAVQNILKSRTNTVQLEKLMTNPKLLVNMVNIK